MALAGWAPSLDRQSYQRFTQGSRELFFTLEGLLACFLETSKKVSGRHMFIAYHVLCHVSFFSIVH